MIAMFELLTPWTAPIPLLKSGGEFLYNYLTEGSKKDQKKPDPVAAAGGSRPGEYYGPGGAPGSTSAGVSAKISPDSPEARTAMDDAYADTVGGFSGAGSTLGNAARAAGKAGPVVGAGTQYPGQDPGQEPDITPGDTENLLHGFLDRYPEMLQQQNKAALQRALVTGQIRDRGLRELSRRKVELANIDAWKQMQIAQTQARTAQSIALMNTAYLSMVPNVGVMGAMNEAMKAGMTQLNIPTGHMYRPPSK